MTTRVFLLDDHEIVRRGVHDLLEAEDDLEVVGTADDGSAAVDLVRSQRPDVVLMDIRMPGTDGIEATQRITGDDDLAGVRVIVLTTFEIDDHVVDAIRAGASGFVGKGIEPTDLLHGARLRTHHDHRLAMAFGLLGLVVDGIEIVEPAVVSKSWPSYWDALAALPARLL